MRGSWDSTVSKKVFPVVSGLCSLMIPVNYDDHARDLLHMINTFRSEMQTPIVGIGHSMGAGQLLRLALIHPSLFSSIICIEPVITRGFQYMYLGAVNLLTSRPDIWPSRDEAAKAATKNVLFAGWDERAMKIFVEKGFRDLPTELYPDAPSKVAARAQEQGSRPVTLTTTRHHETRAYARPAFPKPGEPLESFQPTRLTHPDLTKEEHTDLKQPVYRPETVHVHRMLPFLQPSCHYIYAAKSPFMSAKPEGRAAKVKMTGVASGGSGGVEEGKVSETVLPVGGHYVPFEDPRVVAEEVSRALNKSLEAWFRETEDQRRKYENLSNREKTTLDDEWKWWVEETYGKRQKKSNPRKDSKL